MAEPLRDSIGTPQSEPSDVIANVGSAVANDTSPEPRILAPEQLYKLLVESVRDYAIFVLNATGHVLTWNIGAERIKGYKAREIIGRHFSTFYPADDRKARKPERELEIAQELGRVEDEGWRIRKDGTQFWANVLITALRGRDGRLVGFAKVTRDLTERKEAEERSIRDARRIAEAEAASRTKGQFLATMSHELRTPLNAIGGYADLLLMGVAGSLTADQSQYLERIRHSQQHLLGIINDVLNLSRIESGRVTYDIQPVELHEPIAAVLPMIEPQVRERGLHLNVDTRRDQRALGDPSKIEQILLNLLSNAVKFTERGGSITIEQFQNPERAGIRVTDTGIGIPEQNLESIFEPFVQVGRTLTTLHEGTGLGLSISRDLARAMGGDLTVRSTPGVGSAFELTLQRV